MRQFAGFGTAEETNERFRYLLEHGQTGLSTAFDMPTLMGYDSDHPRSLGEVGREGVAIDSLDDMETLFDGHPARRGVDVDDDQLAGRDAARVLRLRRRSSRACRATQLGGTIQNDILKEYIAQKDWIFPPEPSMRLVTDMIEFCAAELPKWHPISISGYHIREAGLDRRPGAGVHARRRLRLRRLGGRARARRGRLRAAAVLLLRRAPRLLRGDREVPRGAHGSGRASCANGTARRTRARG